MQPRVLRQSCSASGGGGRGLTSTPRAKERALRGELAADDSPVVLLPFREYHCTNACLRMPSERCPPQTAESIRTGAFMRSAHRRGWAAGAARLFAGAALAALIGT